MVIIQLPESVFAALEAQARQRGISLSEYLSRIAQRSESMDAPRLSDEEFERQLDDLLLDVPPLPGDFSRADIYLDHD